MAFDESSTEFEDSMDASDDIELRDDVLNEDNDVDLENIDDDLADTSKADGHHSLEVRRAIEDHLERARLQKELNYLFDDDFADDDE